MTPAQPAPVVREWAAWRIQNHATIITMGDGSEVGAIAAYEEHNALARAYLALRAENEALRAKVITFLTPVPEQIEHGYTLSIMEKLLDAPEGSSGAKLAMIIAQWGLSLDARKAAEATAARLPERLRDWHKDDCHIWLSDDEQPPHPCTCGLSAALEVAKSHD